MNRIDQALSTRAEHPGWNPFRQSTPYNAEEHARMMVEAVFAQNGWPLDSVAPSVQDVVDTVAPAYQWAYDMGRWAQGCADLDKLQEKEALLLAHATPLSAALKPAV